MCAAQLNADDGSPSFSFPIARKYISLCRHRPLAIVSADRIHANDYKSIDAFYRAYTVASDKLPTLLLLPIAHACSVFNVYDMLITRPTKNNNNASVKVMLFFLLLFFKTINKFENCLLRSHALFSAESGITRFTSGTRKLCDGNSVQAMRAKIYLQRRRRFVSIDRKVSRRYENSHFLV